MQIQVRALLEHVEMAGEVLDSSGGTKDAISAALTERGFRVTTNDFDGRYVFSPILRVRSFPNSRVAFGERYSAL